MSDTVGAHNDLHSEQGALPGRAPRTGRATRSSRSQDIAWLEFEKPDLDRAEAFAHAFGFATVLRTADELQLRGTDAGRAVRDRAPGRRGRGSSAPRSRADDEVDVLRLADATGAPTRPLPESHRRYRRRPRRSERHPGARGRGHARAAPTLSPPDRRTSSTSATTCVRTNATQRPPRVPARVQRLGHVVLQSTRYIEALNWYLDNLGMIVSDFLYYPGQRDRGPAMSFIRCDRGRHAHRPPHAGAGARPANRYVHSAYQVCDLDALAAGGEYLREHGYHRSWGIGRHIQGSQIFDYWRDPDGFLVEHFTDGDMFDDTLEPGWAPFTASGLAQWGPPVTKDFLGIAPGRDSLARTAVDGDRRSRHGQRIHPLPPARPAESSQLMTTSILRTADAWYVQTDTGAVEDRHRRHHHRRAARATAPPIDAAADGTDRRARRDASTLVSPVTAPCRVVAQMTNFTSHVKDAGMDPKTVPLTFFRKASGSINGPSDDIVKPAHVRFLDYEVEIGLVIGRDSRSAPPSPTTTWPTTSPASSSPTTSRPATCNCPKPSSTRRSRTRRSRRSARRWCCSTPDELKRFGELRLQLQRQRRGAAELVVAGDMIYRPLRTLQELTRFQRMDVGDLLLTGTPAGTALSAPPKPIEIIGHLLPPAREVEGVLQAVRPRTASTCATATSSKPASRPTTGRSISAPSAAVVRYA